MNPFVRVWSQYRGELGLLAVLAAVGVLFGLTVPHFARYDNLLLILMNVAVIGIVAVGEFFVIVGGGIDISVGKNTALMGVLAANLVTTFGMRNLPAVLLTLLAGSAVGLLNGAVTTCFRIPPFIVTLGAFSMLDGATAVWTHGASVPLGESGWLAQVGQRPNPVLLMFAIFAAGWLLAARTPFGRRLYAIGGNEQAARLAGISVRLHRTAAYVIAGLLSALGGIVVMSQLEAGDPNGARNLEFDAITAVVLGGTSLFGGEGRLFGVLVGAVFMGTLGTGLTQANVDSNYQNIIKGAVLVTAVVVDTVLRRRRAK